MTPSGYLLLGLTAIIAALIGVLVFAVLRFGAAAREAGRRTPDGGAAEQAFLAAALQEAVTKLRAQERASAARADASERLSGEIIASMASGLLVVGLEGEVRILNPAGQRMLGVPEPSTGGTFRPLLGPIAPVLVAAIEECFKAKRPIVRRAVDVHPKKGTGGARHLGVTVSPIVDEAASTQGAICLFSDLTAVVELEEQLRLKDSLARVGELTAGLAHEFRNGLATIHGYSRLLDLERLPADYKPYVSAVREETEALRQVVTNFLDFARPAELSLTAVSLERLANRAADEIRQEVEERGVASWRSEIASPTCRATRCCSGRHSATCAETPWKRAFRPTPAPSSCSRGRSTTASTWPV